VDKGSENNIIGIGSLIVISIVSIFAVTGVIVVFAAISAGMNRDWEREDEEQEKALSKINNKEK